MRKLPILIKVELKGFYMIKLLLIIFSISSAILSFCLLNIQTAYADNQQSNKQIFFSKAHALLTSTTTNLQNIIEATENAKDRNFETYKEAIFFSCKKSTDSFDMLDKYLDQERSNYNIEISKACYDLENASQESKVELDKFSEVINKYKIGDDPIQDYNFLLFRSYYINLIKRLVVNIQDDLSAE
jgi:hypothetical protein